MPLANEQRSVTQRCRRTRLTQLGQDKKARDDHANKDSHLPGQGEGHLHDLDEEGDDGDSHGKEHDHDVEYINYCILSISLIP